MIKLLLYTIIFMFYGRNKKNKILSSILTFYNFPPKTAKIYKNSVFLYDGYDDNKFFPFFHLDDLRR
jgi:hypothetical protein